MTAAQMTAFMVARALRAEIEDDAEGLVELANAAGVSVIDLVAEHRKLMGNLYRAAGVRACRVCGCTDEESCVEGCFWSLREEDLCSRCETSPAASAGRVVLG